MKFAVIGTQFGDEGKGLFTDYLCTNSRNPLVVRFSGGQQAGHTVYLDGKRHVFSNFGSGTLRGVPTFWSNLCTFDPITVVREYKVLKEKGVTPILYVSESCPVTTPFEVHKNRNSEAMDHGTCGCGVGATFQREEDFYSLTANDLQFNTILNIKLPLIQQYYGVDLEYSEFVDSVEFIRDCDDIIFVSDDFAERWSAKGDDIIFEGSQGLLLDQNIGFFPHVTRSNTGTKNIAKYKPVVYYITRAYQTRHGNGPMTNTELGHNIKENPEETNILNPFQGEFKKSLLDIDLLIYGIGKDNYSQNIVNLVITCLDHVENEWRFTYKGQIVHCTDETDFIKQISDILGISSVFISKSPESKNIVRASW